MTPDWAAGKARPRCDGCTCACTCGKSAAAAAAAAAVAAQDEQQLRLSRQLATSRQAKPQVARRLLVDAHADGERQSQDFLLTPPSARAFPLCQCAPLAPHAQFHCTAESNILATSCHGTRCCWWHTPLVLRQASLRLGVVNVCTRLHCTQTHCLSLRCNSAMSCRTSPSPLLHTDVLVVDERAAAETPSKKRRAEPKAASTVPVNGRTASRSGSELGKKANKALPAPRHPSAYALPAAVPKGRVFAINGFHAAHTELVRPSVLVAPGPSMRDSPELGPAAALGSTYVRMRLDALLSSI